MQLETRISYFNAMPYLESGSSLGQLSFIVHQSDGLAQTVSEIWTVINTVAIFGYIKGYEYYKVRRNEYPT